ncbi:MAG: HAD family hydrolase [Nanoarchaeota archaeon]|nr:HAD family hydrolase [Nanoarchaeota archaeon]
MEYITPIVTPTVFLDRDGVINKDKGVYITSWNQFEFLPGFLDVIREFTERGFKIIIVTNQPQIERKMLEESELDYIHYNMGFEIMKSGGKIDGIYYCPHSSNKCECRKPKSGMLLKAKKEHNIDFKNSIIIGNSWKDMNAGSNVGCTTCFLIDRLTDLHKCDKEPDFCIADIYQAKDLIPAFFNTLNVERE